MDQMDTSKTMETEDWTAEIPDETAFDAAVNEWIVKGKEIHLRDVPYNVLYFIYRHFDPKSNWKLFACELGVQSIQKLNEIEGDAHAQRKWEYEMLFDYCVKNLEVTFGDLVSVILHRLKNKYILQKLYDEKLVETFLNERNLRNWKTKYAMEPLADLGNKRRAIASGIGWRDDNDVSLEHLSPLLKRLTAGRLYDFNCFQMSSSNDQPHSFDLEQFIRELLNKNEEKKIPLINRIPSKRVIVLLSYSKDADDIVPELVKKIKDQGMGVVSEYSFKGKGYFETDLISSWQKFLRQSQFVVPILSRGYLADIHEPKDEQQSQGVRFVYDMYTRRYVNDGCLNHYVRPLIMDNVNSKMLQGLNPTLEIRWKIWEDVDKFLAMIKKHCS